MDLSEITKDDIIKAFSEYDRLEQEGQINPMREAKSYLIFWNSKEYSHKYIVGIAYGLKYNEDILDSDLYHSTGDGKNSAKWCMEKNGFVLYADRKFKDYLEKNIQTKAQISTYYTDLKRVIRICQNIKRLKDKNLNEIIEILKNEDISFEEYDVSQRELGFDDKSLFSTLKSKAKAYIEAIKGDAMNSEKEDSKKNIENKYNTGIIQPLNQILYGPPGTGKTYHTINKAIEIIKQRTVSKDEDRNELKKQFEQYKLNGQIEFVTFHQSYGYEEFVEGIKAKTNDNDEIVYEVEKGVFRKISEKAKNNYKASTSNTDEKKDFESVFQEKILSKLEDEEKLEIKTPKKHFHITEVNERTIFFEKADGQTNHSLSIKSLKNMYEKGKNEIIKGGLSVYYNPILEILLDSSLYDKKQRVQQKNYVLIIDEINRGNISKIFGELITLIEESKRSGNKEAVEITLPYSGEKFSVPKNLYILGTMNTADRSIALMDTALRRRFHFEEMMPDLEVLGDINIERVNVKSILNTINQRIEYLYDRDHTIGHAYFIGLKDIEKDKQKAELNNIFRNKIIPLLQEYFYDDWEKILMILGSDFIEKKELESNIFDEDSRNNDYIEDKKFKYSIAQDFKYTNLSK